MITWDGFIEFYKYGHWKNVTVRKKSTKENSKTSFCCIDTTQKLIADTRGRGISGKNR